MAATGQTSRPTVGPEQDFCHRGRRLVLARCVPILKAMRQSLIVLGLILLAAGLLWPWLGRVGLGHLPGDMRIERPGFSLYAPLGSGLVVSVVLSLVLTLIAWFLRR
jgi:DUF2905 family protein